MPIARTLDQHFFKTWSPAMAYVLGYFAADGSMLRSKRNTHFIEFTSTDRVLLEQVQQVICSNHSISERPNRNERWKQAYRLQIGSKEWFNDLSLLGFTQNKSKTIEFPEVPEEFLGHFVRGYFDGDGCAYFKQHWSSEKKRMIWVFSTVFVSGSNDFLKNLHARLIKHIVRGGHISGKKQAYSLVFSRHDSLALYRLMYNTAQVCDMFLPRKREKLEQALQVLGLDRTVRS